MQMIRAIVRSERVYKVMDALMDAQFYSMTKFSVFGRGQQRGMKVGDVTYDEIPKEMIMMVVDEVDLEPAIKVISSSARTSEKGQAGDGKIFVTPVSEEITISSGHKKKAS